MRFRICCLAWMLIHFLLPTRISCFVLFRDSKLVKSRSTPAVPGDLASSEFKSEDQRSPIGYSIKRVSSRERALDVLVFRNWSTPMEEYLETNPRLSRDKALKLLTRTCNDQGQDILYYAGGPAGEIVRFVAVFSNDDQQYKKTNGVAGTVDAHRNKSSSSLREDDEVVELKNLRVHESARRQGIARALVHAVQEYAQKIGTTTTVFLDVELDNLPAVSLYLSEGFEIDPEEEGRMVWKMT